METWTMTEAGTFAGLSYGRALRLVMMRIWRGRQVEGKWRIEAESVRQWKESQQERELEPVRT